jgi:CRISPR-associated endonuclease Cas1
MDKPNGTGGVRLAESASLVAQAFARDAVNHGICVVDGYGLRVTVERRHLVVADGLGRTRRVRRFARATHGLCRLVILGSSGTLSIEALRWCEQLAIGVAVVATDGARLLTSVPRRSDDARLRRIQAVAPELPVGVDIARFLIADKLVGQAGVLSGRLGADEQASLILGLAEALDGDISMEEIRAIEASAAALYWQSWSDHPACVPRFAAKEAQAIPAHWTRFDGRRSVLASANANRKAERPVNALANYCYALLEIEAVLSCHVVGLDDGLALTHRDARGRQSMALDLIEPVRPAVDEFVLDLCERRTFRRHDFTETADGQCRILAPLTHDLAEMMPAWAEALAPVAERVAHALGQAMTGKYLATTPLTSARGRRAQAVVKARKAATKRAATSTTARQRASRGSAAATWSCPECGGQVANSRRVRCDGCIAEDPRQTPKVRAARAMAISARRQAEAAWECVGMDPADFRSAVLPALATIKLSAIVAACGVSKGTASYWRSGKWTPHPSHWLKLAELARVNVSLPARSRQG